MTADPLAALRALVRAGRDLVPASGDSRGWQSGDVLPLQERVAAVRSLDAALRLAEASLAEPTAAPVIHYSDWASQPDVSVYCDQTFSIPDVKVDAQPYLLQDGRRYAWDWPLVTCAACIARRAGAEAALARPAPTTSEAKRLAITMAPEAWAAGYRAGTTKAFTVCGAWARDNRKAFPEQALAAESCMRQILAIPIPTPPEWP